VEEHRRADADRPAGDGAEERLREVGEVAQEVAGGEIAGAGGDPSGSS
jgi:hypothetical protein